MNGSNTTTHGAIDGANQEVNIDGKQIDGANQGLTGQEAITDDTSGTTSGITDKAE